MAAETAHERADERMAPEDEVHAHRYGLTHCRSLPAARRAQGVWVAFLVCVALLLPPSVALSVPEALTAKGGSADSNADTTITTQAAGILSLLGVHAQLRPHAADTEKLPKKGGKEFFQEFLDLALKLLVSINFVVTIIAAVRLWLDQRAAARPREDLRICPHCYELIQRHDASRCPYCRIALAPESRVVTLSPKAAAVRREPAREVAVHTTKPLPPVWKESVRTEPRREEPTVQESEQCEEEEPEYGEEEASDSDDWERDEEARYRRQRVYAVSVAIVIGWIAAGLLLLLRLV